MSEICGGGRTITVKASMASSMIILFQKNSVVLCHRWARKVVTLKYGKLQQAALSRTVRQRSAEVDRFMPEHVYSALNSQAGPRGGLD